MENYRVLFVCPIEDELLNEIKMSLNKGMAVGHERFKKEIDKLT